MQRAIIAYGYEQRGNAAPERGWYFAPETVPFPMHGAFLRRADAENAAREMGLDPREPA